MSKAPEISTSEIETAIAAAGDKFSLAAVAKALGHPRSDTLKQRLERAIDRDDAYFHSDDYSRCESRKNFFAGKKFLITPDEWEIAEGMLFPGHRFVPFVPEMVFPSEVQLRCGSTNCAMRKISAPLGKIFHYHLLLGSEQIFDFLIAEDRANAHLAHHASSSDAVSLEVFDMQSFYYDNDFKYGDALLCTVEDYAEGVISFTYLSGELRKSGEQNSYTDRLDQAVKQIWERSGDYLDIPEQLAYAHFFLDDNSDIPGASIDEYISRSTMVELRAEGDHAVLSVRSEQEHEHDENCSCGHHHHDLPEGLSLSASELDDPEKILAGAGTPLSTAEIEAFMLDAIYSRENDFDALCSRIFNFRAPEFADDVQQAVLLNYLEERFEELRDNYNRADDEPKAEVRAELLEAVESRLEFLAAMGALEREMNESEKEAVRQLASIATKLAEALKLLNNPAFTPDEGELSKLMSLVDAALDRQDEILLKFDRIDENQPNF